MEKQYKILFTDSQLLDLIEYLKDKDFIAYDTETTSLAFDTTIVGISVCAEPKEAFYVVLHEWKVNEQKLIPHITNVKLLLQCLLSKQLIMHNAIFDCSRTMSNFGIDLMPAVHTDICILAHLTDENRSNKLKDLGVQYFGESAKDAQKLMKESVIENKGQWSVNQKDFYKASVNLLGEYGAEDARLTYNLVWILLEELYQQKLEKFFYEDECMPLLKGPTYELNTVGLMVDLNRLSQVKGELEVEAMQLKADITHEIAAYVSENYPNNSFNFNASNQLAWLLFKKKENHFGTLTESGKELCRWLNIPIPYTIENKYRFISECENNLGMLWKGKSKIRQWWTYTQVNSEILQEFSTKYKWVENILKYRKCTKLLSTYVEGIQDRINCGIIRPSFGQNGPPSGRYFSREPNFQNLPRDDKRIKSFIVARPGKVFVGADQEQLEPRCFAAQSQDPDLIECFNSGKDFYAVIGIPIFEANDASPYKNDPNSFDKKYKKERHITKQFSLATPYGTTAFQQSRKLKMPQKECQQLIDRYFAERPLVHEMMLNSHNEVKESGIVYSMFGRPRHLPEGRNIRQIYGDIPHGELPYQARTLLNQGMNHKPQSAGASIMNRAAIRFHKRKQELKLDAKLVLQVHDELIAECSVKDSEIVKALLKDCMENTAKLPGIPLVAEPKIAKNLADLK